MSVEVRIGRLSVFDTVIVILSRALWPCRTQEFHPFSTSSAVRTPGNDSPSSTRVMATAGRMPTTTVSASSTRDMPAMLPIMRPMNESTMSSAEMSIRTPRASVRAIRLCEVVLKGHGQPIVHVDLDRHDQEFSHPQDRYMFHVRPLVPFES